MDRPKRIGVVVPLYNEAAHVESMLRGLPANISAIIVVDDASTDGSRRIVESLNDPRIRIVRHETRRGVGSALRSGFVAAAGLVLDVVVTMDADGQMDARDLPNVIGPIVVGEAQYVKGTRFAGSRRPEQMPLQRWVANRALTRLTSAALGVPELQDAHCGYTAASGAVIAALAEAPLYDSYGVYTSILGEVLRMPDVRIAHVPVRAVYGDESSHIRPRHLLGIVRLIAGYGAERVLRAARRR